MHKLLSRLISRSLPAGFDTGAINSFLVRVNQAFEHNDRDRVMLERSLNLMSQELTAINGRLHDKLCDLSASQQMLEESLTEQRSIINAVPEAIFNSSPEGRVKHVNRAACDLLGMSEIEIKETSWQDNRNLLLKKLNNPEKLLFLLAKIDEDELITIRDSFETLDDRYFEFYSEPGCLNDKFINRVWHFRDVTQSRKNQDKLHFQAFYDSLTGLPNRDLVFRSLDHALAIADRNETQIAVLFIDLDDFKTVNDSAGHDVGDQFLKEVSSRMASELRVSDTIGRLGGDEFLVVLEGVKQLVTVAGVVERTLKIFNKPIVVGENNFYLTCSIGISTYPKDGPTAEVLVRKADMAMYKAKKMGKNRYHHFNSALEQDAVSRLSLESDLRRAIKNKEFVFHYQPKVSFISGEIVGAEALIRWQKPGGDLIFPDAFIEVAEQSGLIRFITQLVVSYACERVFSWQSDPSLNLPISINISTVDFTDDNFIKHLLSEMNRCKVKPGMIELEITESIFMGDSSKAKENIAKLKERGVLLSIDDFGTGYSSFGYLHDLNVDYLKIDKQFVMDLQSNEKSKAIVKSIVDLGINLGFSVVAEGVETQEDHDFLLEIGCHIGQGYYYSRPIDDLSFVEFIKKFGKNNVA